MVGIGGGYAMVEYLILIEYHRLSGETAGEQDMNTSCFDLRSSTMMVKSS